MTVKEKIKQSILKEASYDALYDKCKLIIESKEASSKELADTIFNISKELNTSEDYYYDVLCEVMSTLTGRCDSKHSLE